MVNCAIKQGYVSFLGHDTDESEIIIVIMFLIYETELVLFSAVLKNSVLPVGWDSSHAT